MYKEIGLAREYPATHTRNTPSVIRRHHRLSRHRTDNNGACSNLVANRLCRYFLNQFSVFYQFYFCGSIRRGCVDYDISSKFFYGSAGYMQRRLLCFHYFPLSSAVAEASYDRARSLTLLCSYYRRT